MQKGRQTDKERETDRQTDRQRQRERDGYRNIHKTSTWIQRSRNRAMDTVTELQR